VNWEISHRELAVTGFSLPLLDTPMTKTLKLGKTAARPNAITFKMTSYLAATKLPTPPKKFGHQALVSAPWSMLGNADYGDCVFAGAAHETMLWCKEAGTTTTFTDKAVLSDYSAVTGFDPTKPDTDQGTDMATAASYRRKTGIVDAAGKRHTVAAYLEIKPGDTTEIKQAAYLFSAVGIGIEFPSTAMDQFNAGKPWSVVKGAKIDGGHYVPCIGFDGTDFLVVTWGKVQRVTPSFLVKYMDEGVAYVSLEMLTGGKSLEGFDAAALQGDLHQLKAA
jgi:hypothetical protein